MKILPQFTYSPPTQYSVRATDTGPENVMLEEAGSSSKTVDEGDERVMMINKDDQHIKEGWTCDIESTFEALDCEDRKWLLFEILLTEQWTMDDIKAGFPANLAPNPLNSSSYSPEDGLDIGPNHLECSLGMQVSGEQERAAVEDMNNARRRIHKLEEEWLLIFCQIDALSSSERDEFLLHIFLISPPHAIELLSFQESLEIGRAIQEIDRQHDIHFDNEIEGQIRDEEDHTAQGEEEATDEREARVRAKEKEKDIWFRQFRDHTYERRKVIGSNMKATHGRIKRWRKLGKDREGIFDIAMEDIGVWMNRPLPYFHQDANGVNSGDPGQYQGGVKRNQRTDISDPDKGIGKGKGKGKATLDEESDVDDYIKMYAFEASTKILSLLEQIAAKDTFLSFSTILSSLASRYRVLGLHDLVRLLVIIARSPIPLRSRMSEVVEMISTHIVSMFGELDEITKEWIRIDEVFQWDLNIVNDGLDEVGLECVWAEVMAVIGVYCKAQ